jgi:hypothetical protein
MRTLTPTDRETVIGTRYEKRPDGRVVAVPGAESIRVNDTTNPTPAGYCWTCGLSVVQIHSAWERDGALADQHPRIVHAVNFATHPDSLTPWTSIPSLMRQEQCGKCGAHGPDTFDRRLESYGDDVTCRHCGDHHWYSIGD